ncbi:MAG: threonine-phosphate decarboxylase [Kyrpidia tusciae]|nr:threonine-phosphate decarboxylase [Kyrpidia tusciae]
MDVMRPFMDHGGNVREYRERWGGDPGDLADFSANINPLGPPESVKSAMRAALQEAHRYPDPRQEGFRRQVAERWGMTSDAVIVGNGAAELIFLAMFAWRPRRILALAPSFSEYEDAARAVGAEIERILLHPERGFVPDAGAVVDALGTGVDLLVLANPNNPTGVLWDSAALERVLDEAEEAGVRVLLDEAFLDFCADEQMRSEIPRAGRRPGLFVLRSMTKFYSIPGVRLGYGVASPEEIRRMEGLRPPWSVNGVALAAGAAALEDEDFAARSRRWVIQQRRRMAETFGKLGFSVTDARANFLLAWREDFDIGREWPRLARRGVFVRDCRTFPGLDRRYLRVAVRPERDQERLFAGIREGLEDVRVT